MPEADLVNPLENSPDPRTAGASDHVSWNFWTYATYQVLLRIGWVFKTETVIMPAFLDVLGAGAVARGMLPVLSRLGNSVPQYLLAHRLQGVARLKGTLAVVTLGQAIPWLVLGGLCWSAGSRAGAGWVAGFLAVYTLFWVVNGMSVLTQGAVQGKLIPVRRRGRLLAVSNLVSCIAVIVAIYGWMLPNLQLGHGAAGFSVVFLTTGTFFLLTAGCALLFVESFNDDDAKNGRLLDFARSSLELLAYNRRYRRLIIVVTLYFTLLMLFPHFGTLGRERLGATSWDLALWIVVQNTGSALGGLLMGPIADRKGNRLVLQLVLSWGALIPPTALILAGLGSELGRGLYWLVFLMLGLWPVGQRIVINYLLELAPPGEQTRYLGTFGLWQIVPLLASPGIGWLIDLTSFATVFWASTAVILVAAWQAGRLFEPRHRPGEFL